MHLETDLIFTIDEFKWYYQKFNDEEINSVDNIRLTDVAVHILVVKKNMLDYGTTYIFFVESKF